MTARKSAAAAGPGAYSAEEVATAWRDALAVWDARVALSPPVPLHKSGGAGWKGDDPLAYIDLRSRQVFVNLPMLVDLGARASLTAVLAHEIGHHVRFPHTLGLSAQLELLEKRLIPGLGHSLLNHFFDLLVNEHVGRTRAAELAAVYRGFNRQSDEAPSPFGWFYLAIYEELWGLGAGSLVPGDEAMEAAIPGCRAEARLFAQTFYSLPDVFLQFVYFCSVVIRYLGEPGKDQEPTQPMGGDLPHPDVDDYGGAIYGSPQAERALAEARARGWIEQGREPGPPADPLAAIGQLSSGRPGKEQKAFREALVARHYKRLVDQHLIDIPATTAPPDPLIPTTHVEWEPGEDPRAIDWTASVLAAGAMAPTRPLRRELEPELPDGGRPGAVFVEIYVDTSGSMPDPGHALNAMTLAAQILSASAIRRGGKVRGIIYSTDAILSDWMSDEEAARRFLLLYSGGGTLFPFPMLEKLAAERADVIRVVISDGDFVHNLVNVKGAVKAMVTGVGASRRFVAMLAYNRSWEKQVTDALGAAAGLPQLRVVYVEALDQFGRMAADLARALFGR